MERIMAKKRNGPGRPGGQTNLSDSILDVAEVLFADKGFAGTAMRHVAEKIEANPALINYYFSNKENLFRAVFLRRAEKITEARMARLAELEAAGGYGIEDLVRAFLEPTAALLETPQGRSFLRLHSRLHMEPEEIAFDLRRQVYQVSTRAYAEAFAALLPGMPRRRVYHKVSLMVGAYLYAFSDTNRLGELTEGLGAQEEQDGLIEDVVAFVSAGMRAGQG
ncbi:TetR/AcrR family transcriptional regulator [Poseidonocella sp. HB161398]|uniref:TetR/AcrR family transcriptional regulator n=1 Tax=Poseidonocella sp. HB161398 TaxID=2320855 RepID=UPI001107CFEE|nr:TetR family transcriptional regulator [Poseidonocella sp. HB161398]